MRKKTKDRPSRTPPKYKHKRTSRTDNKPPAIWDQAARWYDTLVGMKGSEYQREVVLPGACKMLDAASGSRVLDLACGQGVFSRFLHQKKLVVEGLDQSSDLIQFARERSSARIEFHIADAGDPKALPGKIFDGVVCILAVQNMENMVSVFKNISRWLNPGGRFVMVLTHPCFRIPRQSNWGFDEPRQLQFRRVDMYQSETAIPILTPPFAKSNVFTVTYHRPLASYFSALSEAGLMVDQMEEWCSHKKSKPGKRAKAENRAREEIPLFMALRAVKPEQSK